jgi:iron complex outermembrane receptor protein
LKTYLFFLAILFSIQVFAQKNSADTTQLQTVNLKAKIVDIIDFKIQSLEKNKIQSNDGIILTPVLNQVAGVVMQQGALNTSRITIRGIGARSQFSTNRLKLYINNVPLTNANGISVLDDIDLNALGNLQIIKGPKSSVFGANLGGHIILKTEDYKDESVAMTASAATFDRYQLGLNATQEIGKTQLQSYFNHIQSLEFRQNSEYERQNLSLISKTLLKPNLKLENLALFTKLKAFIPSSLNETDFQNNPQLAASNWFNSAGFESYNKILLASTLSFDINEKSSWVTSVFFNHRDAYEPRPFDILDETETGFGVRTVYNFNTTLTERALNTNMGLEWQTDVYRAENYNNLYQNTPERESIQGVLVNAFNQNRSRLNVFAEANYQLSNKLELEAGFNFNLANYQTNDKFLEDGLDQSGSLTYSPKLLPNFNLNYKLLDNLNLFANYSMGMAMPGIDESLDDDGFFNPNLNPSFGQNYEFGAQWTLLVNALNLQTNIFQMNVEDLIVARRIEEDRFIGINAGSTRHLGYEFSLDYQRVLFKELNFNLNTNLAYNDFEFTDFVDGDEDFTGNIIPAIPEYDINFSLNLFYSNTWSLDFNTEIVGEMPLDDANSRFTESYSLSNLKIGYVTNLFNTQTQLSFGVNNMFDKNFAASVLPNAVGFGGAAPRYFYPSTPRQFYFKVLINYGL